MKFHLFRLIYEILDYNLPDEACSVLGAGWITLWCQRGMGHRGQHLHMSTNDQGVKLYARWTP